MPSPTTFAETDALARIEAEQEVRRQAHEAEARRQAFTGYGVDLAPFRPLTEAQIRATSVLAARYIALKREGRI